MCCRFELFEEEWMVEILHHRCWQGDGINLPMCPVSGMDQELMSANLPTWRSYEWEVDTLQSSVRCRAFFSVFFWATATEPKRTPFRVTPLAPITHKVPIEPDGEEQKHRQLEEAANCRWLETAAD